MVRKHIHKQSKGHSTAAALFGVVSTLNDEYGFNLQLGDMSTSNGSDPAYIHKGKDKHHAGHGHNGNRSGMDIDFRYVDNDGNSFQDNNAPEDSRFSNTNNQLIYETAQRFGFNVNYQGTNGANVGAIRVGGHNNYGHLGYGLPPVTIRTKKISK